MADDCPECEQGLPPWLATFADLMSLLMCFFVLLLSFAEVDAIRFKKMAEAMKDAFGVQRAIPVNEVVLGTSVIKTEFSPATVTEPSPINEIRQQTTDLEQQKLKVDEAVKNALKEQLRQQVEQRAEQLEDVLWNEVLDGQVTVETEGSKIIVRIQEKGSFASGSDELNPGFLDVMSRIGEAVAKAPGKVVVAGHSDDVPIATRRFRSNWELSSARAVTVVHALLRNPQIEPTRVLVEGHADSHPLVPNDSAENRAVNRRVELVLEHGEDQDDGAVLPIDKPVKSTEKAP